MMGASILRGQTQMVTVQLTSLRLIIILMEKLISLAPTQIRMVD